MKNMSEKNITNTSYTDFVNNVNLLLKNADKDIIEIKTNYTNKMIKKEDWKDRNIINNINEVYKKSNKYDRK